MIPILEYGSKSYMMEPSIICLRDIYHRGAYWVIH